ncbi:ATP12 family chaperone protein [Jiella sp. M17.18]|uniref:ATP12 family chaperone protein n=1 Tax=Jiella sp. M17.18 TaxID=3234247 RepID=UPI0034DFAA6C
MSEIARPELPKRFYQSAEAAEAEGGFTVRLDGRPVKTPARQPLAVPVRAIAEAVAAEFAAQEERIDPATMPMTRLVNTIVDGIVPNPDPVRDDIGRYAETDMLFYRADGPERLVERQRQRWDPILDWAHDAFGARFLLAEGVMHVAQPEASLAAVRRHLAAETEAFRIAALHQATTLTGSALIALALAGGRVSAEEAWELAHLDEDWNIEQWGADEEAMARRALRWEEMRAAALILEAV